MTNPLPMRLLAWLLLCAVTATAHPIEDKNYQQPLTDIKMLSTFLIAANGNMADGNRVVFDPFYSNDVDRYDAVKMTNPGENFGLLRQGYTLAVEARQPVSSGDTLHYKMSNLAQQTYTVNIQVQFLTGTGVIAEFIDRYTNTRRFISLSDGSTFTVEVTSDPASKASDRFYMVFTSVAAGGPLPVKFTSVTAQRQADKSVAVKWKIEEELNVDHYEIERSDDGINFKTIGMHSSNPLILSGKEYRYADITATAPGLFYRIRSVDIDGKYGLSNIVALQAEGFTATLAAYPNPVSSPQLNIKLAAAAAGQYRLTISNTSGQTFYTSSFRVRNGDHVQQVPVSQLTNGYYIITVTGESAKPMVQSIVVKK